jgi:hypothetical protein
MNKVVRSEAFQQRLEGDGAIVEVFATLAETKTGSRGMARAGKL